MRAGITDLLRSVNIEASAYESTVYLDRIFDAFYTTKSTGTDMGLSICRSIIHAHGGELWARANEPRGAVFQFTLPDVERELTAPFHASQRS